MTSGTDRSADMYEPVTRTLAGICIAIALPLLLLAVAWLPAIAMSAVDAYGGLRRPGSQSYLAGQRLALEGAIASTALYSASLVVASLYIVMMQNPRPARDRRVWTAGAIVAGCDFFYWTGVSAPWLFLAPPAAVALLSLLGASISARSNHTQSPQS